MFLESVRKVTFRQRSSETGRSELEFAVSLDVSDRLCIIGSGKIEVENRVSPAPLGDFRRLLAESNAGFFRKFLECLFSPRRSRGFFDVSSRRSSLLLSRHGSSFQQDSLFK